MDSMRSNRLLAQTDVLSAGIMAACVAAMVHGRDWVLSAHTLIWHGVGIAIHGTRMLPASLAPRSW
jgi:hypothetical protein